MELICFIFHRPKDPDQNPINLISPRPKIMQFTGAGIGMYIVVKKLGPKINAWEPAARGYVTDIAIGALRAGTQRGRSRRSC